MGGDSDSSSYVVATVAGAIGTGLGAVTFSQVGAALMNLSEPDDPSGFSGLGDSLGDSIVIGGLGSAGALLAAGIAVWAALTCAKADGAAESAMATVAALPVVLFFIALPLGTAIGNVAYASLGVVPPLVGRWSGLRSMRKRSQKQSTSDSA